MKTLKKLQNYMGKRRILLPASIIMSALSTLTGMLPYIFIWIIIRELFKGAENCSQDTVFFYAVLAAVSAVAGVILYFLALMLSHLAAFRVETNMRRRAMEKIIRMPLGFFDNNTSGRIRKIIDDNAGITHSFLAHQMPDLAGTALMPIVSTVLIFVFDWRMGIACIIPVILSMAIMSFMMGGKGRTFMKSYMNSLEEMNTEAVEYVRGIPVC